MLTLIIIKTTIYVVPSAIGVNATTFALPSKIYIVDAIILELVSALSKAMAFYGLEK